MATGVNFVKLAGNLLRSRINFVHEISDIYKPAISKSKAKLMEFIKEKADNATKSELARKMRIAKGYYSLEMAPPSINEIQKIKSDLALLKEFMTTGCYKYLTVKQAWLLFLIALEISLWFFLGETIGKMNFVGYKV